MDYLPNLHHMMELFLFVVCLDYCMLVLFKNVLFSRHFNCISNFHCRSYLFLNEILAYAIKAIYKYFYFFMCFNTIHLR